MNFRLLARPGVIIAIVGAVAAIIVGVLEYGPSWLPSKGAAGQFEAVAQADTGTVRKLSAPVDVTAVFTPSGHMGDGERGRQFVQVRPVRGERPRPGDNDNLSIKVTYKPGSTGWAGVYWQVPPNNWGDQPGIAIQRASTVTFWAVGEKGDEIVEFKVGGINSPGKPHRDSFQASTGNVSLMSNWKQFTISLREQNLASVLGGFAWVATSDANPNGATFYVDRIVYE